MGPQGPEGPAALIYTESAEFGPVIDRDVDDGQLIFGFTDLRLYLDPGLYLVSWNVPITRWDDQTSGADSMSCDVTAYEDANPTVPILFVQGERFNAPTLIESSVVVESSLPFNVTVWCGYPRLGNSYGGVIVSTDVATLRAAPL